MIKLTPGFTIVPMSSLNLKRIGDTAFTQAEQRRFDEAMRAADGPTGITDTDPSNRVAEVTVAGKRVATIYKNGGVSSEDAYASKVRSIDRDHMTADQIARELARLIGGSVRKPT